MVKEIASCSGISEGGKQVLKYFAPSLFALCRYKATINEFTGDETLLHQCDLQGITDKRSVQL